VDLLSGFFSGVVAGRRQAVASDGDIIVKLTAKIAHATLIERSTRRRHPMSLRHSFVELLILPVLLASGLLQAAEGIGMKDCFDASNPAAAKACRMEVWAAYQAIQVAQTRHRMTLETCQFGTNITADQLVEHVRDDVLKLQHELPDMAIVPMAIGVLSPPSKCPLGVAADVGGLTTGPLLQLCISGFKPGGDPSVCLAYVAAMRDSLNALSGDEGTDNFFCPPKGSISVKEAVKLLIDETKRDLKSQEARPAAEVMAEALSRKYPCR